MESSPRSIGHGREWAFGHGAAGRRWCARPWPVRPWRTSRPRACHWRAERPGRGIHLLVPGRRTMYVSLDAGATWSLRLVPTPRARARPASGSGPTAPSSPATTSPVPPLPRRRQDLSEDPSDGDDVPTTPGRPIRQRRTRGHRGLAGSSALATIHSRCRPAMARARQGTSRALTPAHGGVTRVLKGGRAGLETTDFRSRSVAKFPSRSASSTGRLARPDRPGGRARAADPAAALDRIAHRCEVSLPVAGARRDLVTTISSPVRSPEPVRENLVHGSAFRQRPDQQFAGGPARSAARLLLPRKRSATRPSGSPRPGSGSTSQVTGWLAVGVRSASLSCSYARTSRPSAPLASGRAMSSFPRVRRSPVRLHFVDRAIGCAIDHSCHGAPPAEVTCGGGFRWRRPRCRGCSGSACCGSTTLLVQLMSTRRWPPVVTKYRVGGCRDGRRFLPTTLNGAASRPRDRDLLASVGPPQAV